MSNAEDLTPISGVTETSYPGGVTVYDTVGGGFTIADGGGWFPGLYDSPATARHALTLDERLVQRVVDRVCYSRLTNRAITMADLETKPDGE